VTKPEATICIPWRPSPSRIKPYEVVTRFWEENFPDWPIITADSNDPEGIFNVAQARNNAVRQAKSDVVVVCDADTIPPIDSARYAVADPVGVQWPHTIWRLIPAEWADKPIKEFPAAPPIIEHRYGLGGTIICTTEEWWQLGGEPEEFIGWGSEDRAFYLVVATLSTFRRIGGTAYSIEHNDENGRSDSLGWDRDDHNDELVTKYIKAAGRPSAMRQLIMTRGGRAQ
jgi:hypothetical protein